MATANPAPVQSPLPITPRRPLSTKLLNFFLGNPVRAFLSCIVFFWMPLALTIWRINHG